MKPRTLVLGLASLAVVVSATAPAEIVERVIVKVNGDIVTQSEFEARQVAAVQAARISADRIEGFLRQNNARILQEAIDDLLVVQRAADLGMRMPPAYLKEVIENIKKDNNITSEEEFQNQLRREGMTLEDLKRNVEKQVLRRQVLTRELEPKLALTEAEARADYEARKADYTKVATLHLQEILVKGDDDAGAKARALEIVKRARDGEDFTALAHEHSASPTRVSGGDLGTLSRGEMNAELEKVAFELPAGAVSDPFPSGDGFRILRVVEKTEGTVAPFDQVKAEIMKRLGQERYSKEYERYLEELRKTAMIDVRVREVPLQVTVPATASSLLEVPPSEPAPEAEPKAGPDNEPSPEFSTTPQSRPERLGPAPLPGEDAPKPAKPAPKPSPTPTPPPP